MYKSHGLHHWFVDDVINFVMALVSSSPSDEVNHGIISTNFLKGMFWVIVSVGHLSIRGDPHGTLDLELSDGIHLAIYNIILSI